jgi:hypothetical protein
VRVPVTYANVASTVALLVALGGGTYAIAASSAPPLHACAKRNGGALRLASKCRKSERAVTLAQVGPAGPQGPAGPGGATGAAGSNGAPGSKGAAGNDGASAVTNSTVLSWGGQMNETNGDDIWRQQRVLGTFTKAQPASRVVITIDGSMSSDAFSCLVQVRVDGLTAGGSSTTKPETDATGSTGQRGQGSPLVSPYSGSIVSPFSITAGFGALASGLHTVTLWTASNSATNNCGTDPYNYDAGSVTILELG